MKKAFVLVFILLIIFSAASAKVLRVGYSGPKLSGVDFTDVSNAIAAATGGDTIQLYQNAYVGNSQVNKRLTFLGFGYRLEANAGLQAVPSANNEATLSFIAGSENSVVQGLNGTFYVAADNVTLSRCNGTVYLGVDWNTGQSFSVSNVTIVSSYVSIWANNGAISNALVSNSIVTNIYSPNAGGLFTNNISTGYNNNFGSYVVKNNIFTYMGCPTANNAVFENNLFANNCTIAGSNNQFSVNISNVFTNWNNGTFGSENNLSLKTGSPAIGFGTDGNGNATDAGIYGGEPGYIYKLSGIPAIPSIYKLTAPQLNASTNPYTITVSIRSNN